jgi:hypothetical protein
LPHHLLDLQILNDDFVKLINDMKLWVFDKEECLLGIVKQLTRILSDWENDTEEMITILHDARDNQVGPNSAKHNIDYQSQPCCVSGCWFKGFSVWPSPSMIDSFWFPILLLNGELDNSTH